MTAMDQVRVLLNQLEKNSSSSRDLHRVFAEFFTDHSIEDESKIIVLLCSFYINSSTPFRQYASLLDSSLHQRLGELVFLTNEVFDDEQVIEDITLYIFFKVLLQIIGRIIRISSQTSISLEILVKYLTEISLFRSMGKIESIFNDLDSMRQPFCCHEGNTSNIHETKDDEGESLSQAQLIEKRFQPIKEMLRGRTIQESVFHEDVQPLDERWLQASLMGLFRVITSEDQMAFLMLFSRKWCDLYKCVSKDQTLMKLLQALLSAINLRKDVPTSIVEDFFLWALEVGNEVIKKEVLEKSWNELRLNSIVDQCLQEDDEKIVNLAKKIRMNGESHDSRGLQHDHSQT